MKKINNLINNKTFSVDDTEKGDTVTPCIDVYKANIKYDGSLNKLRFRVVVRGDMQNKY